MELNIYTNDNNNNYTPNAPTKSSGFRGFDSSRLLILRGGILMSVNFDRGSPRKFDSRTLNRETLNRWTGRTAGWATRPLREGFTGKGFVGLICLS